MMWKGSSMVPSFILGLLLLMHTLHHSHAEVGNKYINVGVVSNWGSTPLHMEASEYFAEESEALFWKFMEGFSSSKQLTTPEALYKHSLETAGKLVSQDKVKLLKLSLALRTYSPKIEMYRQLPKMENNNTNAIHVRVGDAVFTSSEALEAALRYPVGNMTGELFPLDHVYPSPYNYTKHAVLYADFADPAFAAFHKVLSKAAEQDYIGYVLRHLVPESSTKMNLQGWGVDLAIKNVEYKAMDDSKVAKEKDGGDAAVSGVEEDEDLAGFRIGVLKKRKPELSQQLDDFSTFLMRKNVKVDELNVWDFKDMGLQASQKVVTGSDPLKSLRDISQNFPSLAGPLTRLKLNNTLKSEIQHNQQRVGEENLVLINGRVVDPENMDAFAFLNVLKEEVSKIDDLQKLKLDLPSILPFVSTPLPENADLRFKIDSDAIIYANNLEEDDKYERWPRHVSDFMRRVYPGQMRFVAKNFFTVIFIADFTTTEAHDGILNLNSLINQNLPARVGLLPLPVKENPASVQFAKVLRYIAESEGDKSAFRFLVHLYQNMRTIPTQPMSVETLAGLYNSLAPSFGFDGWNEITASAEAEKKLQKLQDFTESLGLDSQLMFINGFLADSNREILDAISEAMNDQTPYLQTLIQQGTIHDGTNIYQLLMNPPDHLARTMNIAMRFNKYVPPSETNPLQIVSLIGTGVGTPAERAWESLSKQEKTSRILSRLSYLESNKDDMKKYSHILFADISTLKGATLALEAINFVEASKLSRVALVLNPREVPTTAAQYTQNLGVEDAILKAGSNLGVVKALLEAQIASLRENTILHVDTINKVVEESRKGKKLQKLTQEPKDLLVEGVWWAKHVVDVPAGASAVLVNGRKIMLEGGFVNKDFEFLEMFQDMRYGKLIDLLLREPKFAGVDSDDLTSSFLSTVVMQAVSRLSLDEQSGIVKKQLSPDLKISAEQSTSEEPTLIISAILDPLSKASQKFSPVLLTLRKLFAVKILIVLNPRLQLSDLPLKRYYHYLFSDEVEFDESGQVLASNIATLSQLPLSRILTLGMDTPDAWLVQPIIARYDLDNIKLEDLGEEKVLTAVFELEHILVEGNCYDISSLHWGMPTPPRGLELVLQHNDPNMPSVDTLVMSNFGYFQLKANPGIWKLRLAEGRGTQIFSITKDTVQQGDSDSAFRWVTVSSFLGETVLFKVERKPGMEGVQLLVTEDEASHGNNAWDAISGLWKGKDEASSKEPTTLHIFSVASGHLYERLTRIMMLSVIKQTKNPVKFWFLKNYMSPKFKEIIPHMAKEYNFDYELVTYKWPSWLRKQTEKQRIIWAYKILFLDVLFPLGIKKIIFVDADQVVRTDMMELYNMDLQGAPLAYTPFCNNKPEMDGFRFWKAGYWKDHLRGRPYHISALYVIDLQQFRRTAAGDQLRSTYDMLSRDPNSLANLDQDLPNYLQHNVKIHSLPQEWLWCETWCPEDTKATAKTIDLCNNPLTKASKLENAVRILGDEWISLDNEVKDLEQRILENKSTTTSTHPHSSHTTHHDTSAEKINEAYNKLKLEL